MIYRITLNGYNFLMTDSNDASRPQKLGFFATRIVDADNEEAAITKAIYSIQNDSSILDKLVNNKNDKPGIEVEKIESISINEISTQDVDSINKSYIFYPDDYVIDN